LKKKISKDGSSFKTFVFNKDKHFVVVESPLETYHITQQTNTFKDKKNKKSPTTNQSIIITEPKT